MTNVIPNTTLPSDFLRSPAPSPTLLPIDFKKTALPEYDGLYAVVIDGVMSPEECNELVYAAERVGEWERAMINIGGGRQRLEEDVRKCGRIIWDNQEIMDRLWACIAPLLPELQLVGEPDVIGRMKAKIELTRLNERIRLLKYGPGGYFKRT
jgi:hypothetical protein